MAHNIDIFQFSLDIRNTSIDVDHILVSYDVTALFTNVPAHETITILVEKAFSDNWFNETYDLNLTKDQLRELLELATTNQPNLYSVKKQMQILSANIGVQIKPVFQTRKIGQILALKEKKSPIVNNQCVVYKFHCDLFDADYVGFTARHLHQRSNEHKYSAIGSNTAY